MKSTPIDYDTVREMLRTATPDRILRFIGKSHPADIALLFKGLDPAEVRQFFDILFSARRAAKTLTELPPELLPDILALIDDEKIARVIVRADPDDAVTIIDSLTEERRESVLSLLDPERREEVREIISYPESTVGRIMNTDFMALAPTITAQGAIDKIRERGELASFFYLYVVDQENKLVGVVPIRNLVIAPRDRTLSEMMIADPLKGDVFMDQEEAARIVAKYELLALPIVDEGGRLEGIITVDDVIDIINEESTEDMYKMAGLAEEDRVFTPISRSVKMRLPWTMLNLLTTGLAASVVTIFQGTITELVALVTFMPIVAGVGGNGATQTATVIIRCCCRRRDRPDRGFVAGKSSSGIRASLGDDTEFGIGRRALGSGHPSAAQSDEVRSGAGLRDRRDRPYGRVWLSFISRPCDFVYSLSDLNLRADRACGYGIFLDQKKHPAD
jgi:magnesium transporter